MTPSTTHLAWRSVLARYAWMAAFLCARAHYVLTIILGPVFGWR